jgi:4-carboxymuconolactone decarboxylase
VSAAEGRRIRQVLWGPDADALFERSATAELAPELNRMMDEFVFGQTWTRPELPVKLRSLVTISAVVALGNERALRAHIAGGLSAGLAREEITETIMHLAWYVGLPATLSALEVARQVFRVDAYADGD